MGYVLAVLVALFVLAALITAFAGTRRGGRGDPSGPGEEAAYEEFADAIDRCFGDVAARDEIERQVRSDRRLTKSARARLLRRIAASRPPRSEVIDIA